MNVSRVGDRVADGGHDVPVDRILARRLRSHAAFGWFARAAHAGLLIGNSELARLIAQKHPGSADWTVYDQSLHPDLTGQL